MAEKIRNFIEYETVVVDENKKIRLTVSLGVVAVAPGKLKEIEDYNVIIKLADSALYQAKTSAVLRHPRRCECSLG